MTFGKTLRSIRKAKGLPQREVARRIPMDFSRFSRLENDRSGFSPTRETVEKIAKALEATPAERGELLAAAGRLDREVESLAHIASGQPAIVKLLQIATRLSPEQLEQLIKQAERRLAKSATVSAEANPVTSVSETVLSRRKTRK